MTFATYTTGIPNPNNNPSTDVTPMQTNANSINAIIGIDHIGFNASNGGYHNIIHLVPNADPVAIAGIGQLYAKTIAGDQELFYETGNGVISQITTNIVPVAAANGYTYLPGGLILQWGTTAFAGGNSHESGTVLFTTANINFPNNCFIVIPGLQVASSSETTASDTIAIRSKSTTQFVWVFNSSSGTGSTKYPGFYWTAIGN